MPAAVVLLLSSYWLLGLLAMTVLALSLVSLRKETFADRPLAGLSPFTLFIAALCTLIALLTLYVRYQRTHAITLRFDKIALADKP